MTPYLCFCINTRRKRDTDQDFVAVKDGMAFILKYFTSAQYLDLHFIYWILLENWSKSKLIFPNLQTLVVQDVRILNTKSFHPVLTDLSSIENSFQLHCLGVNGIEFCDPSVPPHWSVLTHQSMSKVAIHLDFWYLFMREIPQLQWAALEITNLKGIEMYHDKLYMDINDHESLTSLHISLSGVKWSDEFPLALLFKTTPLLALRILSLSSFTKTWISHLAVDELTSILKFTPHTLLIGANFFGLHQFDRCLRIGIIYSPDLESCSFFE
ncbi:hypothetical protein BDN70DRAFT_894193 [Pholiota conissans]|uniref:Uncharacterized protein n=1 Tax=Pholiota conissans TaxID=109636 RepID=A0A9P6CUD4_9AGAR|nr:hypothetical protein BDN70DRAFT_894193 [Pholiota conissans]